MGDAPRWLLIGTAPEAHQDISRWREPPVFFSSDTPEGRFAINGLPPGRYVLAAYHPKSHGANQGVVAEIEIKDGQVTAKNFIVPVPAK